MYHDFCTITIDTKFSLNAPYRETESSSLTIMQRITRTITIRKIDWFSRCVRTVCLARSYL